MKPRNPTLASWTGKPRRTARVIGLVIGAFLLAGCSASRAIDHASPSSLSLRESGVEVVVSPVGSPRFGPVAVNAQGFPAQGFPVQGFPAQGVAQQTQRASQRGASDARSQLEQYCWHIRSDYYHGPDGAAPVVKLVAKYWVRSRPGSTIVEIEAPTYDQAVEKARREVMTDIDQLDPLERSRVAP